MNKFSVVIVSWNVAASLKRCLESVINTGYQPLEIIVIDNASADKSASVIKTFKQVKLIKNRENIGFPKAVNQGLAKVGGDLILLLNPDCIIPQDFFSKSLAFFDQFPDAALMSPQLTDPDGKSQGSVFPEPSLTNTIREFWLGKNGLTAKYTPRSETPVKVNAVSGACMVFPRSTLTRNGKLTEAVFMYYEDLDYCRRIRRSGWNIYFNPGIKVVHEHGRSSGQIPEAKKYLRNSSIWYNGFLKHHLMWFVTRTGQILHRNSGV